MWHAPPGPEVLHKTANDGLQLSGNLSRVQVRLALSAFLGEW